MSKVVRKLLWLPGLIAAHDVHMEKNGRIGQVVLKLANAHLGYPDVAQKHKVVLFPYLSSTFHSSSFHQNIDNTQSTSSRRFCFILRISIMITHIVARLRDLSRHRRGHRS